MQDKNKDYVIIGLILVGLLIVFVLPPIAPIVTVLAKAAIMLAGAMVLVRVHRKVSAFLYPPSTKQAEGEIEIRLLIQSMGIVARADGKIEKQELDTISEIHARIFGIDLQRKEVLQILVDLGSPIQILAELRKNKAQISPLMKQKIVQACHLVTISDLDIDDRESAQITAIGHALGYSNSEIDEIVALAEA